TSASAPKAGAGSIVCASATTAAAAAAGMSRKRSLEALMPLPQLEDIGADVADLLARQHRTERRHLVAAFVDRLNRRSEGQRSGERGAAALSASTGFAMAERARRIK